VLLAGRGPLVWLHPDITMPKGCVDAAALSTSTDMPDCTRWSKDHVLKIPTIHVHGLDDPGVELHRGLMRRYCDPSSTKLIEWEGKHRVPIRTKDVDAIAQEICHFHKRSMGVRASHTIDVY
jgi:hypothetical protein